ncbi:MAG: type VI secretion system-associated FHA domain protein TagH [Acidobacteriota bacterium]
MILILEVASPPPANRGDASRQTFHREGGSIGRDKDNSWVLPHRKVSGHHALISYRNGVYHLEDTSRNGVCLNSPGNRLVRGRPYALKSGDSILIDPYEIRVSIAHEQRDAAGQDAGDWPGVLSTSGRFDASSSSEPDDPFASAAIPSSEFDLGAEAHAGQTVDPLELLGVTPKPALVRKAASLDEFEHDPLLDAHFQPPAAVAAPGSVPRADAMTIPDGYDPLAPDDPIPMSFPSPSAPLAEESVTGRRDEERAAPLPLPVGFAQTTRAPEYPPSLPDGPRVATDDDFSAAGLAAVLAGAGLNPADVTPELARDFGEILRVVVSGVIDVMQARQQIKEEFGLRTTRVRRAENNPLKFSVDAQDALHNLLVKRNPAYLTPVAAFEDAFADLRDHQMAMLAGMRAAFESMLAEFDADRLQQTFDHQLSKGLVPSKKLRYWDLYREKGADIVKDREASFRRMFGEAFARAYDEQLDQLKAEHPRGGASPITPRRSEP